MGSRTVGGVIGLVLLCAALGYKFIQRDNQADDRRTEMMSYIEQLPDYDTHATLYNGWFEMHHNTLFKEHYHIGGRRRPSWFDGEGYLDELFTEMIRDATAAGYTEQADSLRTLHEELYFEEQ